MYLHLYILQDSMHSEYTWSWLSSYKSEFFFSYVLSCSRKGFNFSNFCVLSITGCQHGFQTLLSKFSSVFARTEQAEK